MCVKEWKRIAERETKRYREKKAFLRGVSDAGSAGTERSDAVRRWVLAVDYVLEYLHRVSPEKECFMRLYYGLDGERRRTDAKGMIALSFALHVSTSALYEWRKEILTLLVIAAAQTRALHPYETEPLP